MADQPTVPRFRQRPPADEQRPHAEPTSVEGMMRLIIKAIVALVLVVGVPVLVWAAINMVIATLT